MAATIQVEGPQEIKVYSLASGETETLGYTEDGVALRSNAFYRNVYGDRNGGQEGPPVEVLYLGETLETTVVLSKYDPDVWDRLSVYINPRANAPDPGLLPDSSVGTPMFDGSYAHIVTFEGTTNKLFIYPSIVKGYEIGRGTKYSRLTVTIEGHRDYRDGRIYTSGPAS